MAQINFQPPRKRDARKGDDRNLVIVDQDFGQPDLEDRMWLFWIRNKAVILGIGGLLVAAALGAIAWFAYSSCRVAALQEEYQALAQTPEARIAFARRNSGNLIAGTVSLEAADQLFKDKKYAEAAEAYVLAQGNFPLAEKTTAAFAGRAQLGFAVSKILNNDRDGGIAALTALARTPAYPEAQRGEALYKLAILALEKNDLDGARAWLEALERDLGPTNPWVLEKISLLDQVPALTRSAPEIKPAAESTPAEPTPTPAPETKLASESSPAMLEPKLETVPPAPAAESAK